MEKWIVEVNNSDELYEAHHKLWLTDDFLYKHEEIHTQLAISVREALELYVDEKHMLIVIYSNNRDYLDGLPELHDGTNATIIVVKKELDRAEFEEALSHGATYYWSLDNLPDEKDAIMHTIIQGKAFIRWYLKDVFGIPYDLKLPESFEKNICV